MSIRLSRNTSYPEFNPNTLHGVLGFSIFSGVVLAIQIHTGFDISEIGLATMIFKAFASTLGQPPPYLDFIVFIVAMIAEVGLTIVAIFQIAKHRLAGAFVSGSGFFGVISVCFGSWEASQFFMIFGVILIIVGGIVASKEEDW